MKKKNIIKSLSIFSVVFAMICSSIFCNPIKAAENNGDEEVYDFLINQDLVVQKLNELANSNPIATNDVSLCSNNDIQVEKRIIDVSENLSLVNIRTISTNATIKTVTDEYGLIWGGYEGWGGYLTATYKYYYSTIYSPSTMITTISNADGNIRDLDLSYYRLESMDEVIDLATGYKASAHIDFNMIVVYDIYNVAATYTHKITFNSGGTYTMSWF